VQLSSPESRHGVEKGLAYLVGEELRRLLARRQRNKEAAARELRCFGGESLGEAVL
jgi:hypothetical protein